MEQKSRWNRELVQLTGKYQRKYIHQLSPLVMQSSAQIGAFPHKHHDWELSCPTSAISRIHSLLQIIYLEDGPVDRILLQDLNRLERLQRKAALLGVSALEFDTKGTYLASVTRSGCLTLHKFESLYSHSYRSADQGEDRNIQMQHCSLVHGAPYDSISAVRWNPSNQHEIAYTRLANGELTIFGIEHSQAIQVLKTRPAASDHEGQGLSDIAFLNGDTRVLASDASGAINMWDRRASDLPQRVLKTNKNIGLTSIQLYGDQRVYGASKDGFIYVWDLGGASQSDKEVNSSPQISINLDSMLNEHQPLEAQINIRPKVIQSININPSCPYQLGFHTDDGWSGVLNMHNYLVSHVHCPPPPLRVLNAFLPALAPRKPSWLLEHSIYAAASSYSPGLNLLDFYPHPSSRCRVVYDPQEGVEHKQSKFVPLSGYVTACATHPHNGTIVAGTMESGLLMISQKHFSKEGDGDDDW